MKNQHAVYLLFLNRELVYVGKSKNPEHRIETHRRNGRPFDYCLVVPTPPGDEGWVEMALIKAFEPSHNRTGIAGREGSTVPLPVHQVVQIVRPAPEAPTKDSGKPLTTQQAERRAQAYGLNAALKEAIRDRSIPWAWASEAAHRRIIREGDLDAWIDATLKARFAA